MPGGQQQPVFDPFLGTAPETAVMVSFSTALLATGNQQLTAHRSLLLFLLKEMLFLFHQQLLPLPL